MKKLLLSAALAVVAVLSLVFFAGSLSREARTIRAVSSGDLPEYLLNRRFASWGDEALPGLERLAVSTDDRRIGDTVTAAFFSIKTAKSLRAFVRAVRARVDDAPEEDEEWWAATRVFLINLPHLASRVHAAVEESPPELRQEIVDSLVAGLRHEEHDVREACASALGDLGLLGSTKALREALANEKNRGVRYHILFALGTIGGDDVVEFLVPIATSGSDDADTAAWSLGRIGTPRAVDVLVAGLKEAKDESDQEKWIHGLSEVTDRRAEAPLLIIARDQEHIGSNDALAGLGRCGGPDAESFLLEQAALDVRDNRATSQITAVRALGSLRSEKAIPLLMKFVASPEQTLRNAAVDALGQIRGAAALEILVTALGDEKGTPSEIGWAMRQFEFDELCRGLERGLDRGDLRGDLALAALLRALGEREAPGVVVSLVEKCLDHTTRLPRNFAYWRLLRFVESHEDIARACCRKMGDARKTDARAVRQVVEESEFSDEAKREMLAEAP